MAGSDGRPLAWTELADQLSPSGYDVVCTDFSLTLLHVLTEINLGLTAERRDVAFNTNGYDGHTLVNLLNPETGKWMLLDPTFDLVVKRADGGWATAEDVSEAATASNWSCGKQPPPAGETPSFRLYRPQRFVF